MLAQHDERGSGDRQFTSYAGTKGVVSGDPARFGLADHVHVCKVRPHTTLAILSACCHYFSCLFWSIPIRWPLVSSTQVNVASRRACIRRRTNHTRRPFDRAPPSNERNRRSTVRAAAQLRVAYVEGPLSRTFVTHKKTGTLRSWLVPSRVVDKVS